MSLSGTFQYVLIPADETQPVQTRTAPKAGGLTDDALVQQAKAYFKAAAGVPVSRSPAETQALAASIRQQYAGNGSTANERMASMSDEELANLFSQSAGACDITALTVPTRTNQHYCVSLYAGDGAKEKGAPYNRRATELLTACGHVAVSGGVYGDCFVGRAQDDEEADIWQRVDFVVEDVDPASDWCRTARSPGGGGGSGKAAASSLGKLMTQQMNMSGNNNNSGMQVVNGSGGATPEQSFGMNGAAAVVEEWGSWTQNDDEVELQFKVPAGTKAKYCKVAFGRTSLKVAVSGQVLSSGKTFDPVVSDECTFTLEDNDGGTRTLTVTLQKAETGRTWAWVVR